MPRARETCAALKPRRGAADARSVTLVTPRRVLLAGCLAGVLVGIAVLWSTFHVPVDRPWGWLYSDKEWSTVQTTFARRGFEPESVQVVTAAAPEHGEPLALINGRSSDGRTCVALVRGTAVGGTICHLGKPMLVFRSSDSILVLVRPDVTVTVISQGGESGVAAVPTGIGFAFNAGFIHRADRLRARDAHGHVLASVSAAP